MNNKSNSKFFPIPEVENVNTYVQNARSYGKRYLQKNGVNFLFNAGIKYANSWLKKNLPETIWKQIVSYFEFKEKMAKYPGPDTLINGRMYRGSGYRSALVTDKLVTDDPRASYNFPLREEQIVTIKKDIKTNKFEAAKGAKYVYLGRSGKSFLFSRLIDSNSRLLLSADEVSEYIDFESSKRTGPSMEDAFIKTLKESFEGNAPKYTDFNIDLILEYMKQKKAFNGGDSVEDKDVIAFFNKLYRLKTVEKKDLLDSMIKANDVNNDAPVGDKDVLVFKQSFLNCFRDVDGRIDLDFLIKEVDSIFTNYCNSEITAIKLGYTSVGPVSSLKDIYMGRKIYDSVYFDAFRNKNYFEEKAFKAGDVIRLKPGCSLHGFDPGKEMTLFKQDNMLCARSNDGSVFFFDPLRDGGYFEKVKIGSKTYVGTGGDIDYSANLWRGSELHEEKEVNGWGHYVGDIKHYPWPLMDNKVPANNSTGVNDVEFRNKVVVTELSQFINKHSLENETNTPDFILGQLLYDCLALYNKIMKYQDDKILPTEVTEMYDNWQFREPFEKAILSRHNWYSIGDEQECKEKEDSGYVPGRVGNLKFPQIDSVFKEAVDKFFYADSLNHENKTYVQILKDAYGLKKGSFYSVTYNVKTDEHILTPVFNIDHETCLKSSQIEGLFTIVANPEIIFGPNYTYPKPPVNSMDYVSKNMEVKEISIWRIDFGLYYFTENNVIDTDLLGFERKRCLTFKDKNDHFIYADDNCKVPMLTVFTDKAKAANHLKLVYNWVVCRRSNSNHPCKIGDFYRIHFISDVSVYGSNTIVVLQDIDDSEIYYVKIKDLIMYFNAVLPDTKFNDFTKNTCYKFVEIPLENKISNIEERFNYDEKIKASLINTHRNHTKLTKCKEVFFIKEDYEGLPKNTKVGLLGNKLSTMTNNSPMVVLETENFTDIGREFRIPNNLLSKSRLS